MASDWARDKATDIVFAPGWVISEDTGGIIDVIAQALRVARAEGMASIAELVQDHAEGGNVENYGDLRNNIESMQSGEIVDPFMKDATALIEKWADAVTEQVRQKGLVVHAFDIKVALDELREKYKVVSK